MNVLFLDQFNELGGAQLCLLDLVPAIQGAHAMIPNPDGPLGLRLRRMGVDVDEIHCPPYRSGRKTVSDALRYASALQPQASAIKRAIAQHKIDIVYVNGPRLLTAAALATGLGTPLVFHAHNRVDQPGAVRLAGTCLRATKATMIACCRFVEEPFARYVDSVRRHVVYSGVADGPLRRVRGDGNHRIGIIGRIAPEKGHGLFLGAARLIAGQRDDCKFIVCGAPMFAEAGYYDTIRAMAVGLPVEFTAWRDDATDVLAGLDLLVVPSASEGVPRVVLEAFAAGVPVLASNVGGIPEVIEDGVTGFLIDKPTAETLARRTIDSLDANVTERAREAWRQHFTLARYREEIVAILAEVFHAA